MPDLRERFHALDRVPVPDLWHEVERRAEAQALRPGGVSLRLGRGATVAPGIGGRISLLAVWLLVLVLLAVAIAVGAALLRPSPKPLTMRPTGSMLTPRCGAASVRLADGRVLIIGGWAPSSDGAPQSAGGSATLAIASAPEVYDPTSGTFTEVDGIASVGDGTSATLLADGRVLIAGGRSASTGDGCGTSTDPAGRGSGAVSAAFVYDPVSARITPTGSLVVARSGHAAVLLADGQVLIVGGNGTGANGTTSPLASAELYDPTSGTFTSTGSMSTERGWYRANGAQNASTAVLLGDGRVFVTGGVDSSGSSQETNEIYSVATGTFGPTAPDPASTAAPILVMDPSCRVPCALRFDPRSGTLEPLASPQLPYGMLDGGARAVVIGDRVVLIASGIDSKGASVTLVDFTSGSSQRVTSSVAWFRRLPSATLLADGRILIAGGVGALDAAALANGEVLHVFSEAELAELGP